MPTSAPASPNGSDHEMTSSPDEGTRGFVAVNNASSNGSWPKLMVVDLTTDCDSESSVSSRLSSPQEHSPRDIQHHPQPQGVMYAQPHGQDNDEGHKRKRSGSYDEPMVYGERRPYQYGSPRKPEPQHMANRALHVLGTGGHNAAYSPWPTDQPNGHTWHPERPIQSQPSVNGSRPNTSEAQMGGVQREGNMSEAAQPRPWDHQSTTNGHDQYNHETHTGGTAVTPKRKRNFSNRTKTGCLTCRNRKKKCDETQPICELRSSLRKCFLSVY